MARLAAFLMSNLELLLAAMSIPVICVLHFFVSARFDDPWKVTAAAAITVGVLHGFLGWMVRARQRNVRVQLLQRLWATLQGKLGPSSMDALHPSPENQPSDQAIRLALAQLPALLREPLVIRTMPLPMPPDAGGPEGLRA